MNTYHHYNFCKTAIMKKFLLNQSLSSLVILFLLTSIAGCKGYIEYLPPKDKPEAKTCRIHSFYFTQPNGTVDSNVYTFGVDNRIASFKRVGRAPDGTITAIRNGELFYTSDGLLDHVNYPLTEGVLTLLYDGKKLTKLVYKEKGMLVQEYDITTNSNGRITSMTGRGLNNTKMVYTLNAQGYVSKWERYDTAGNRLLWAFNENFDPKAKHSMRDIYPGIPVWIQNNIATMSFDPQIDANGPWQTSTTYNATDAQGSYNGIIKEVKATASFETTREGYLYNRTFSNTAGAGGSAHYRYTNCTP
jgi:predicted small lipoprotein YifL